MSKKVENQLPTRFIHLRIRNEDGEVSPRGGLCVAYDTIQDGGREDVFCAFARCSKHDIYNKSKARVIAEGRLTKWLETHNPKLTVIRLNGRTPRVAIMDVVKAVGKQSVAVSRSVHVDKLLTQTAKDFANDTVGC